MSKNRLCIAGLVALCLLFVFVSNKDGAAQKQIKADYFDPKHLGRGQTIPIIITGNKFSAIKSVSFSPPEGLSVGEYKVAQDASAAQLNYKSYEIPISVSRDAALGKRAVLFETPEGQITKQIEIVPHVPVISDLKITKAYLGSRYIPPEIRFNFLAFDEADDLGTKPDVIKELGPQTWLGGESVIGKAEKVEMTSEPHKVRVYCVYTPGRIVGAGFNVAIRDKHGYQSNQIGDKIVW